MAQYLPMETSESPIELSNFVSVMPVTVGIDIFTISLSSSIFGCKMFEFKYIKCRSLFLMFPSSVLVDRFELALGLNLYTLKVEVLISDRESDFCDTLFD